MTCKNVIKTTVKHTGLHISRRTEILRSKNETTVRSYEEAGHHQTPAVVSENPAF